MCAFSCNEGAFTTGFVECTGIKAIAIEVGYHKVWVVSFLKDFRFAHNPTFAAPTLQGLILKINELTHGLFEQPSIDFALQLREDG